MMRIPIEFAMAITLVFCNTEKEEWALLLGETISNFIFIFMSRVAQADPNVSYATLPKQEKTSTLIHTILINRKAFSKNVRIR
jgi:hypothetical protein